MTVQGHTSSEWQSQGGTIILEFSLSLSSSSLHLCSHLSVLYPVQQQTLQLHFLHHYCHRRPPSSTLSRAGVTIARNNSSLISLPPSTRPQLLRLYLTTRVILQNQPLDPLIASIPLRTHSRVQSIWTLPSCPTHSQAPPLHPPAFSHNGLLSSPWAHQTTSVL